MKRRKLKTTTVWPNKRLFHACLNGRFGQSLGKGVIELSKSTFLWSTDAPLQPINDPIASHSGRTAVMSKLLVEVTAIYLAFRNEEASYDAARHSKLP